MGEVTSSFLPLPAGYQDLRPDVPPSDSALSCLETPPSCLPGWAKEGETAGWSGRVPGNHRGAVGWGAVEGEMRREDSVARPARCGRGRGMDAFQRKGSGPSAPVQSKNVHAHPSYSCLLMAMPLSSKPVQTICPALQGPHAPHAHGALPSFRTLSQPTAVTSSASTAQGPYCYWWQLRKAVS